MQFDRAILRQLESWRTNPLRKPLILRGARQVGKTHILKAFAGAKFPRTHYLNFESNLKARQIFEQDLNPSRIIREIEFLLGGEIDPTTDLIIFDELQLAPKGITSLKYFREDLPQCAVCAAGSLIGLSLNADSFPVGQVDIVPMYPLTFKEFLSALEQNHLTDHLDQLAAGGPISPIAHAQIFKFLTYYFVVGGMPAIVAVLKTYIDDIYKAFTVVREQQTNLIETYLNDFAKYCGKTNAMHIERIFRAIPNQMTAKLDGRAARFTFKEVVPGIAQYAPLASAFDWLKKAGLLLHVPVIKKPIPPLVTRERLGRFKAYLLDVGLLGALTYSRPEDIRGWNFSNFKGYFAENFVAQELMSAGVHGLYCWKEGTAEVEFVLDRGSYSLPIEVKSGNYKHAKSLRVFFEKYNPKRQILLTGHAQAEVSLPNVTTMPIYRAYELGAEGV